jgi:NTP pyrophosphatase (non-canonical NTP hydrolase)
MDIKQIQESIDSFVSQRDWGKYHTPKNIAIALSVEVSELLEIFQWMKDDEIRKLDPKGTTFKRVREEFADSMIYLLRFADVMNIDVQQAVEDKISKNKQKYPVHLSKGDFVKYSDREE